MAAFLPPQIASLLVACEAAGELSNAIEHGRADGEEYHRLGKDAKAFADLLMKVNLSSSTTKMDGMLMCLLSNF
jgi:hypothetical protein